MAIPDSFKTFADKDGRITRLPVKLSKKVALSEWLFTLLEDSKTYTEREVNDIFGEYVEDFALMRRMLVEAGWLERDSYGREYRKAVLAK
jgi:hypothetical protein